MKNNYFFKRTLSAVVMLMASCLMWAYDFEVDGICYNVNEDGESVEVAQKDYWDNPSSGDIVIPSSVAYEGKTYSVTSIGDYAFYYCDFLTSVVIPNSVTSIGYSAFMGCSSLTSIVIPNSVTSIGYSAFEKCSSLTSVEIPNSVASIENYAFYQCSSLSSIVIPNSVTSIGGTVFWECSSLTSIIVADGNSVYDSREGCNAIIETASNTLIIGCQNTVIPNSVTSIGYGAFMDCSSLTSVEIPNSVTSIGGSAFNGCSSLTSVEIPNSVTSIGDYAFNGCSSLTSIIVADDNSVYDSREGCNAIIETASNTLIKGCKNTIIPNNVTSIGGYAFFYCDSLTSVVIPNSVTSIGGSAFNGCSSLTSVEIPNSVTSIGDEAFSRCFSLASIEIPNSVTSIGYGAFNQCSSLTSVICYAEYVPELGWAVFFYVPQSEATLYVPASALEAYKAVDQWKDFGTILTIDDYIAGITSTEAEQEADATYYTLDGVSVKNPTKRGIYIKNGKKIYMK